MTPVTRGVRTACFLWVQSLVREDGQRALLFDMDNAIQKLNLEGDFNRKGSSAYSGRMGQGLVRGDFSFWAELDNYPATCEPVMLSTGRSTPNTRSTKGSRNSRCKPSPSGGRQGAGPGTWRLQFLGRAGQLPGHLRAGDAERMWANADGLHPPTAASQCPDAVAPQRLAHR